MSELVADLDSTVATVWGPMGFFIGCISSLGCWLRSGKIEKYPKGFFPSLMPEMAQISWQCLTLSNAGHRAFLFVSKGEGIRAVCEQDVRSTVTISVHLDFAGTMCGCPPGLLPGSHPLTPGRAASEKGRWVSACSMHPASPSQQCSGSTAWLMQTGAQVVMLVSQVLEHGSGVGPRPRIPCPWMESLPDAHHAGGRGWGTRTSRARPGTAGCLVSPKAWTLRSRQEDAPQ